MIQIEIKKFVRAELSPYFDVSNFERSLIEGIREGIFRQQPGTAFEYFVGSKSWKLVIHFPMHHSTLLPIQQRYTYLEGFTHLAEGN